jgi:hypothetical protein
MRTSEMEMTRQARIAHHQLGKPMPHQFADAQRALGRSFGGAFGGILGIV